MDSPPRSNLPVLLVAGCVGLGGLGMCAAGSIFFLFASRDAAPSVGAGAGAPTPTPATGTQREPGRARGRVIAEDGRPIRTPGVNIRVGVSGAIGDGYAPAVDADGWYETKVQFESYRVRATIDVPFNGQLYANIPLHPVQDNTHDQQASQGIVQDFVWKLTGPRPGVAADPANFTAWYGASINMRPNGWREDLKKAPPAPPAGARVTFTVAPRGPLIDGSPGKTLTFERGYDRLLGCLDNGNLNDIPIGVYTVSGFETAPDGSRRPLLMQTAFAKYGDSVEATFAPGASGGAWPCNLAFVRPD